MADTIDVIANETQRLNRRSGLRWAGLCLLMVAMTPPLYMLGDMICDRAGIGLDPGGDPSRAQMLRPGQEGVATGRVIKSLHNATVDKALKDLVVFSVDQEVQQTEVGRYHRVTYHLRSVADRTVYLRPMHYVSDEKASRAFLMIECFCFNDMALNPGESVELPVVYGYSPDLDPRVSSASITYTLYPLTRSELRPKIEPPKDGSLVGPELLRQAGAAP